MYFIPQRHSSLYAQKHMIWISNHSLFMRIWNCNSDCICLLHKLYSFHYSVLPDLISWFCSEIIWQHCFYSLPTSSLSSSGFRHRIPLAQKQVVTPAGHFLSHLSINWGYSCWYCLYCVQDSLYIFVPLSYGSQLYFSFSKVGSSIGNPQA